MKINNKEKTRRAGAALLALILSLSSIPAGAASPDSSLTGDTASTAAAAETEEELSGYGGSDDSTGVAADGSTEFSTDGITESATDGVAATPSHIEEDTKEEQSENESSDGSNDTATDDFVPRTDYEGNTESVTVLLPNELRQSNAEENERKANAGEERDPVLEICLSREEAFPEDGYLRFSIIKDEELAGAIEEAEAFYQDYEVEPLLPLKIGVFKKNSTLSEELHEEYTGLGPLTVRIYMEDTDFLDQNYLLHKADNEEDEEIKWETLNYVLYERTENSLPCVEFETDSLSDFFFVSLSDKNVADEAADDKDAEEDHSVQEQEEVSSDQKQETAPVNDETEKTVSKFDQRYPCSDDIESMDFSSCRIFVATDDPSVLEGVENYSEYNGLYLLTFSTEEETKNAYTYFFNACDFVEVDEAVVGIATDDKETADGTETAGGADTENEESSGTDAITVLNELAESSKDLEDNGIHSVSKKIAVVDTGASEQTNVIERVSVIGDTADDDNGHGDDMISYILSQDPDADILSIKALDADGVGHVSDLYAAIEYAVSEGVDIINLSVSAHMSEGSEVISRAVKDAVDAGIIVVGAAGNNNKNAKYYIPGGLDDVIVAGACDSKGQKNATSNFGDTVDYYIVAETTSEAAARLSGFISKNGVEGIENVLDKTLIYNPDYTAQEDREDGLEDDILVHTAYSSSQDNYPKTPSSEEDSDVYITETGYDKPTWVKVESLYEYVDYEYHSSSANDTRDYWEEVLGHTSVLNVKDSNGNTGKAVCVDPYMEGANTGKTFYNIWTVNCPSIIKTLYYGTVDTTGIDYLVSQGDSSESRNKWVLIHYALCYYTMSNNLITNSGFETGTVEGGRTQYQAFWRFTSTRLRSDVASFMQYIDDKPTPEGYSAYMLYPSTSDYKPHGYQCYIYLTEKSGVTFHKGSTNSSFAPPLWPLTGAQYWVYDTYEHASKSNVDGGTLGYKGRLYESDINGNNSNWLELPPGTYYMIESYVAYAGNYYRYSDKIYEFTLKKGEFETVEVKNTPRWIGVMVQKSSTYEDIENNNSYGLSGATFQVYNSRESAENKDSSGYLGSKYDMVTGDDGKSNEIYLPPGTYYLLETRVPKGHKLMSEEYMVTEVTITVEEDGHWSGSQNAHIVEVSNDARRGKIQIQKESSETSESIEKLTPKYSMAGAKFEVYSSETAAENRLANVAAGNDTKPSGYLGSATDMTIESGNLSNQIEVAPGTYYVVEVQAPADGHHKRSTTVYPVDVTDEAAIAGEIAYVNVKDDPVCGYLKIQKHSTVSGFPYSMEGAEYNIYDTYAHAEARDETGLVTQDRLVTNADGNSDTVILYPGKYYIIEEKAPSNGKYARSDTVYEVTISTNHTKTEPLKEDVYDAPAYAPIKIRKKVAGNMGNRYKQFSFTVTLKNGDNSTYNRDVSYQKGEGTGTLTPDAQGKIYFTLANDEVIELKDILYNSTYTVSEEDYSAEGYVKTSVNETGIIQMENADVLFTNIKDTSVPTGIGTKLKTGLVLIPTAFFVFAVWFLVRRKKTTD